MIIKEVFKDYKYLYDIFNREKDKKDQNLRVEEYFVREITKRGQNNIVSVIEVIIPLILFIAITIIAILNYKADFILKYCIGIVWLVISIFLETVILMINVRIMNKKVKNREKSPKLIERIIIAEKFLFEFIVISAHLAYLLIKWY